jgi:hypothetical protein
VAKNVLDRNFEAEAHDVAQPTDIGRSRPAVPRRGLFSRRVLCFGDVAGSTGEERALRYERLQRRWTRANAGPPTQARPVRTRVSDGRAVTASIEFAPQLSVDAAVLRPLKACRSWTTRSTFPLVPDFERERWTRISGGKANERRR